MSTESAILAGADASGRADDLERYRNVSRILETTQGEIEELEHTEAFDVFQKQLGLLRRRLLNSPQSLRQMFIDDGMQAIVWEFRQDALGRDFTKTLWSLLLRDDDMSAILLRFIWNVPLKFKRKFIAAIDAHLSDRYPIFKGLSQGWPGQNGIPPYIRSPEERARDFELVNQGYLGYMNLGYSAREVDLFVWLETLRDKQCEDRACELGVPRPGREPKGGCPVKIHIPEMLRLLGTGKFAEALELIESCNPLPDVTGRVCPQELQCQGVCTLTGRPIEIGQLEWFLPEREKLAQTSRSGERLKSYVSPWAKAEKPPIAVIGSGPAGLINAYLLAAEGYPVTIFEAFHELGGVLRYGIPEFRLPNSLIDDVVAQDQAARRPVRHQFRGRQDRDHRGSQGRRVLEDFRRHRRRPAALHERAGRASARRDVGQRVPDPRQPDAGAARGLRNAAARGEGQERSSSSAAATPRWTRRAPPSASAASSPSSIAAPGPRCRRGSRSCITRSRKASSSWCCAPRASSPARNPLTSATPSST